MKTTTQTLFHKIAGEHGLIYSRERGRERIEHPHAGVILRALASEGISCERRGQWERCDTASWDAYDADGHLCACVLSTPSHAYAFTALP